MSSNKSALQTLPPELLQKITNNVRNSRIEDLRSLAMTCSVFFNLSLYDIYNSVFFREDARSVRSLLALASGPRAHLVKELSFRPSDPTPTKDNLHFSTIELSKEAYGLLGTIHLFPELDTFVLDVQWNAQPWCRSSRYNDGYTRYKINTGYPSWKTLLNECFAALGKNPTDQVAAVPRRLTIRRLPPEEYTFLNTPEFNNFLDRVQGFHIVLMANKAPSFMCPYPEPLTSNLNASFLTHLKNVEVLHIEAAHSVAIDESWGQDGAVEDEQLIFPKLQNLRLDYCLMTPFLINLFYRQMSTLEILTLNYCFCDDQFDWYMVFDVMADAKPQMLKRFEVLPEDLPQTGESYSVVTRGMDGMPHSDRPENFRRRLFPRGVIGGSRGELMLDSVLSAEELTEGLTMSSWNTLQDIIDSNKETKLSEPYPVITKEPTWILPDRL